MINTTALPPTSSAVHTSQHMRVSNNLQAEAGRRELISRVTQLDMRWVGKELRMRFAMRETAMYVPLEEVPRRPVRRSGRNMGRP